MNTHMIEINTEACVGCGQCLRDCPAGNLTLRDRKAQVRRQDCIQCGHCVAVCPKGAVSMTNFDEAPVEYGAQTVLDPQTLLLAIQSRRSIRQFTGQPVSAEVVERVLQAGRFTPTAKNAQGVSYLVLRDEIGRFEGLALAFLHKILPVARHVVKGAKEAAIDADFFFKGAPVAVLVVSGGALGAVDGALAASSMALMAEASGLGVLYSGFFTVAANRSGVLRRALGLGRGEKVAMTLVLGHPDVTYHRTAQREPVSARYL